MIKRIALTNSFFEITILKRKKERGAILFISLMLLLVMTLIGVATFENSITEEKISSNIVNVAEARFAGDVATRMAVAWLNSLDSKPKTCKTSPCCQDCVWERGALNTEPSKQTSCWWQGSAGGAGCSGSANGIYVSGVAAVKNQPQYVIEESNCNETLWRRTYRITSRGSGVTATNSPSVFNTTEVSLPLPPDPGVFSSNSADMPLRYEPTITNTIPILYTGSIVGIWIGTGCINSRKDIELIIEVNRQRKTTYYLTLPPIGPVLDGQTNCPRCNMQHAVLPVPIALKTGDALKMTITTINNTCALFQAMCNIPGPNMCDGNFRYTLDGVTTFCN